MSQLLPAPGIPENRGKFRERLLALREAVEPRVSASIEAHRMSRATVRVTDASGQPVPGVEIGVEQTTSSFRFGANSFMLNGFDSAEQNHRWEELFAGLFNQAVVPFLWKDLEPERGKPRFSAESPMVFRRPPPDAVLDFCERYHIEPKGHCLSYHQFTPDWMPKDGQACRDAYAAYFAQVGARYHKRIPVWDVVNEALSRYVYRNNPMPPDWVRWSFRAAREHFPGCQLILNEATCSWEEDAHHHFGFETHPFFLLAQNLLLQGIPVDALGLQYHLFNSKEEDLWQRSGDWGILSLSHLLQVLDHYQTLDRPLHISEITIPCYGESADDEALQAEIAEMLYRTWFSHPSVHSITYWNVVDGFAYAEEGALRGALVRKDLSEKAIYRTLKNLIHNQWRTRLASASAPDGTLEFRGFHGHYCGQVSQDRKTQAVEFDLLPGQATEILVKWA